MPHRPSISCGLGIVRTGRVVERRSFRQWGQLMVGAVLAALAAAIGWSMVAGGLAPSVAAIAWCAVLLVLSYVVFLRPCVVVDDTGVEVRNIVRDHAVPWAAVTGAGSSWSLVVDSAAGPVSSWAISGTPSPGRDALLRRRRTAAGPGGFLGWPGAGAAAGTSDGGASGAIVDAEAVRAGAVPPALGASAAAIAALIERRITQGPVPEGPVLEGSAPEGPASQGPVTAGGEVRVGAGQEARRTKLAWPSVVLLAAAAFAVPLAVLV